MDAIETALSGVKHFRIKYSGIVSANVFAGLETLVGPVS